MAGEVDGIHGFARKLASSDKKTRDKAISLLIRWLSAQKEVGEDDTKKIWKALFYCMWHADKVPVQDDLAEKVASLLDSLNPELSVQYLQVYLTTMRREWSGIDRLRLDKFCLLMRKCLNHAFLALEKVGWNTERTNIYMDVFRERTLLADDTYAAHGVNLHLADMYLDELRKFLPIPEHSFLLLLEPFLRTLASCSYKPLLRRVRQMVFDPLVDEGTRFASSLAKDEEDGEAGRSLGSLAVSIPLGARLFELAACPSTRQANRKILYELHDAFNRLGAPLEGSTTRVSGTQASRSTNATDVDSSILEVPATRKSARKRQSAPNESEHLVEEVPMSEEPVVGKGASESSKPSTTASKKDRSDISEQRANTVADVEVTEKGDANNLQVEEARDDSTQGVAVGSRARKKAGQAGESINGSKRKARLGKDSVQKQTDRKDRRLRHGDVNGGPVECGNGGALHSDSPLVCRSLEITMTASENWDDMGSSAGETGMGLPELAENGHVLVSQAVISKLEEKIAMTPLREVSNGHTDHSGVVGKKKRKRDRLSGAGLSTDEVIGTPADGSPTDLQNERGIPLNPKKKVRFSLKNNLVWKPNSAPLPPQFMRTPPSATPRGSALKPGLSPGPLHVGKDASDHRKRSPRVLPLLRRTRSVTKSLKAGKMSRGRSF